VLPLLLASTSTLVATDGKARESVQDLCSGERDGACANGWSGPFAVSSPAFVGPVSVLHDGLTGSIPWVQQHGRNRIPRQPVEQSDYKLHEKIKEAVACEDYQLAARLKQQMRASATTVSATVWEATPDPQPSSATEGELHQGLGTAEQLQKMAKNMWSSIVSGVNQTFAADLAASERLVVSILRRAAELGSRHVRVRPIQAPVPSPGHCHTGTHDMCCNLPVEDWHKDAHGWLNLGDPAAHDKQMLHGAVCFAARQESDPHRQEKLRKMCIKGDTPAFEAEQSLQGARTLYRIHLNQQEILSGRCLDPAAPPCISRSFRSHEHIYSILSTTDFCKVAAGTYKQSQGYRDPSGRCHPDVSTLPGGRIVHPQQCLHNLQRLVLTELPGIFQPFPWVYGKQAGMLNTMRLLEHNWNTTLSQFSDDLMSANQGGQEHPHHHHYDSKNYVGKKGNAMSSSGTSQTLQVPNFMGPIGPDQPPALPWDLSRYDVLLDIADKQRDEGVLTEASHRRVSEQLVLAGRFHRAHAAFENALQPEWVDSLHKVCDHPVARKILEHRLRTSGFNASLELFSIMYTGPYQHSSHAIDPHAKGSLFVDLHNPLPLNVCPPGNVVIRGKCHGKQPEPAVVAAELADFVGADLI
jgi:hypothetical protein